MSLLGRLLMGAGMQLPRTLDNIEQRQMREREMSRREQIERARMERDDEKLSLQRELGLLRLAQSTPRSSGGSGGGGPGGGSGGGGAEEAALAQTAAEEQLMPEEVTALRERRNPFMTSGGAAGEMPDSERWRRVFSNFNRNLARSMAGKDADSISRSRQIDQETEARERIIRGGDTTTARNLDMARGDPPMDESGGVVLDKWSGENKPTSVGSAKIAREGAAADASRSRVRAPASGGSSRPAVDPDAPKPADLIRSLDAESKSLQTEIDKLEDRLSKTRGSSAEAKAERERLQARIDAANGRREQIVSQLDGARSGSRPTAAASPAPAPASRRQPDMAAAEKVKADYRAGRITREQATQKLRSLGFQ
ncbi:hypothetical protein UFOVP707_49 [uncultured Caudovirales phage]|uniref:Uncharacterized protein n=1 Tax=uncultured Caudovirales phage TaxID=2100421 RepID=A0A6J5NIE3_9CAUD|nr:hypothetical protein UFOVP707_49 [uncultured Caudovirales phage]